MKYLFFDTEKSNCYHFDKICEFGYVLTDENFNIIKKDDIPMSPGEGREYGFDKMFRSVRGSQFHYGYDIDYYYSCPEFPHYYKHIKNLIEDKDTLVFAFAASNDIKAINQACQRYHLEPIKYDVYDVQTIYSYVFKNTIPKGTTISLENAYLHSMRPGEMRKYDSHLSRDDALMTMEVLKSVLEKTEMSLESMIYKYCPECTCRALVPSKNPKGEYLYMLKTNKEKGTESNNISNAMHALWGDFCKKYSQEVASGKYKGKLVAIWSSVKTNEDVLHQIIDKIKNSNKLAAVRGTYDSDYLVCLTKEEIDKIPSKLHNYSGKILTAEEFIHSNC